MGGFDELIQVVARLRGEGGCPWDRAQTPQTMRPYLLEEVYEVLDVIDRGAGDLRKELGDLLFQIVLLARMAEEAGQFDIGGVVEGITAKMIRRHPHVFDPNHVEDDAGAVSAWEARKAKERDGGSVLDGVPDALPALLRAHRISEKAGRVGFDFPDLTGVRAKVDEELGELDEALASGDEAAIADEFGDVLFSLVNLGRFLPVASEEALRGATAKFEGRFRKLEQMLAEQGGSVHTTGLDDLEAAWQRVKEG